MTRESRQLTVEIISIADQPSCLHRDRAAAARGGVADQAIQPMSSIKQRIAEVRVVNQFGLSMETVNLSLPSLEP